MPVPPDDKKPEPTAGDPIFEDAEATQIGKFDSGKSKLQGQTDRPYFIVLAGESLGRMFRIDEPQTVIGRAADATLRLQDDGVSRRHAMVVQIGDDLWIQDLNSANGTLINGERVQRRVLHDGDQIQMGATTILKFTYSDELEEAFQRNMYDAALHDGLTKAFNKRHFLDRLPTEIAYAQRHQAPLSLMMLDVDHFKSVNDKFGHPAGDYVLTTLAQIVANTIGAEDLFARYGGEEFSVLCRRAIDANALPMAEQIRSRVEANPFEHHGRRIPITISIGLATFVEASGAETQLIADADLALYEAKHGGRNRVVVFKPRAQ